MRDPSPAVASEIDSFSGPSDNVDAPGASWHSGPLEPNAGGDCRTSRCDDKRQPRKAGAGAGSTRAEAGKNVPPANPGNLSSLPRSRPVSSLSGTHDDEADLADEPTHVPADPAPSEAPRPDVAML